MPGFLFTKPTNELHKHSSVLCLSREVRCVEDPRASSGGRMAPSMLLLVLLLLAGDLAASLNSQFGQPSEYRTTAININYQDVPETLILCVEATCPLIPMSVLCA
ncbi:serine protease inhibitor Kazal-type 2 isoform X3 [Manis javanica]|uniref:serine protease inhibitor Kazal-type 2 isoform X3 n=1 Tax=Manis javanica TaxID=9974 RepID=UPI003C6D60B6